MGTKCTLKIHTPTFALELEGSASIVRAGYEGVRRELLHQLGSRHGDTEPNAAVAQPQELRPPSTSPLEEKPEYVWVFRSNDLYHKIHVIERDRLYATGLGRYVQPRHLKRIYVESDHARSIEGLVPSGKTLWSELTKLGRERLRSE